MACSVGGVKPCPAVRILHRHEQSVALKNTEQPTVSNMEAAGTL